MSTSSSSQERHTATVLGRVRVGTHALKNNSKSTLRGRIVQHRGTLDPPGGNHRGSIFRLLIGLALARREPGLACPTWGVGSSAAREVTAGEAELEAAVSRTIARMEALLLPIEDAPGPASLRGFVERNAIALLSNYDREAIDRPSSGWLGAWCPRENSSAQACGTTITSTRCASRHFLAFSSDLAEGAAPERISAARPVSGRAINRSAAQVRRSRADNAVDQAPADLAQTLIIVPCSGRKSRQVASSGGGHSILNDITPDLSRRLQDARRAIASEVQLDEHALLPAWRRYSGELYKKYETTNWAQQSRAAACRTS